MSILSTLKANNKVIYVVIVSVLALSLLLGYIPALAGFSSWVTPPVALFLGLIFALLCGQAYPKFNKKVSKKLLQYSVIGLGFGMNLHASLASGKEGMIFTIISVIGTMVIGMLIGRKVLKMNRDTAYLISSGTAICGGSAIAAVDMIKKRGAKNIKLVLVGDYNQLPSVGMGQILKDLIEKVPRLISWILKLLIFNLAAVSIGVIGFYVFGVSGEEYNEFGKYTIPILLIMANVAFVLYDFCLTKNRFLLIRFSEKLLQQSQL